MCVTVTSLRSNPPAFVIAPKLHEIRRGMMVESSEIRKRFEAHNFIHFAGGETAILRWLYTRSELKILIYPLKISIVLHHLVVIA